MLPAPAISNQLVDGIEPPAYRLRHGQRPQQPRPQLPRAHRGERSIDDFEESRASNLRLHRPHHFEVAPGHLVHVQQASGALGPRRPELAAPARLHLEQEREQRPRGAYGQLVPGLCETEPREALDAEVAADLVNRDFGSEAPVIPGSNGSLAYEVAGVTLVRRLPRARHQDFLGVDAIQLGGEFRPGHHGAIELTGRDVGPGETD